MSVLRLRRRPSPVLPDDAFPRGAAHPFMLHKEWTPDAAWEIPAKDLAPFGGLAERVYALALRGADAALADDDTLHRLDLDGPAARMRRSRDRGEAPLVTRMDFALDPVGPGTYVPRLLELNGDTAGNLVEGALLQREWGQATGLPTAGDDLEAALVAALRALPAPRVIWHHPGDPYIASLARYLAELAACDRVEYPEVPGDDVVSVYKMFRWGRLWAGRFPEVGGWIGRREVGVYEPAWGVLLQHKGLLPWMWENAGDTPSILPATLDGPGSLPDGGAAGWACKSFHGVGGAEVTIHPPGDSPTSAVPGHVWQTRVAMVPVDGRYPILCAALVGGRFAGALVREDVTFVSRTEIVAPLAVIA